MSKIDILNLEWPSSDRDLHIVTPVLIYLKKKYNITFKTKSIFEGYVSLLKYRPKILLISNFAGAGVNHEIVQLAFKSGIRVVSFISEGNVKAEALEQFLWGHNQDRKLYVDKMLLWSERSKNIFLSQYPNLKDKLVTTGATGFDRYKLLKFKKKRDFLKENQLGYDRIIGIAAWGFDHLFGDYYKRNESYYLNVFGQEQIDMHRHDLFKLQKIYKSLIENNPDILFILRYHPGTIDFEKNEFYGLDTCPNVFVSSKNQNTNYQISDLMSVSDLWMGYETTTALESWLLNKQTFLINPSKSNFIRENVHRGSPIVQTGKEAQDLINEYFKTGTMLSFERLTTAREEIIKEVIEYGDGKNHVRAADEIMKIYHQPEQKIKFHFNIYKGAVKQIVKQVFSKSVMKQRWPELKYQNSFSKQYQKIYDKAIDV